MKLNDFVVKAKANTYAKSGERGEVLLEDGGKELLYKDMGWSYRDRYFGFNPFLGEEIVRSDGGIMWGMNYFGRVLSEKIDAEQLYGFLRKAMRLVTVERPFRGPAEFQEGDWSYRDEHKGTIEEFEGMETIYFQKEKVYELKYHGGYIK